MFKRRATAMERWREGFQKQIDDWKRFEIQMVEIYKQLEKERLEALKMDSSMNMKKIIIGDHTYDIPDKVDFLINDLVKRNDRMKEKAIDLWIFYDQKVRDTYREAYREGWEDGARLGTYDEGGLR